MNLFQRAKSWLSPKNVGVTITDVDAMRQIFGMHMSPSGQPVTDITAMQVTTVYACINKLSGAVSQLPINLYRHKGEVGGDEPLGRTPLWWLLNESPDPGWTAASWKEWQVLCVALRGDAFTLIERDKRPSAGGAVRALVPLNPDDVRVFRDADYRIAYAVTMHPSREIRAVLPDDMIHITGCGFNGLRSYSVIQHAGKTAVGNSLAASEYAGRTFKDGAMPQIAIKFPKAMTAAQADFFRTSFASTYNGNEGRKLPLVLTEGSEAQELSMHPADAQLLESRQFERHEICQAFGVPPILIGDSEKVSSWGTGIEQITIGFVRYTVKPMLKRWEEELNRKLYRKAPNFLRFELSELMRGDSTAQAAYFRAAIGGASSGSGWMTINEVRATQNLAPVPGGDVTFTDNSVESNAPAPEPA